MTLADTLFEAFEETRQRAPHIDCRLLAQMLDVSEGELQASRLGRGAVTLAITACDLVMLLPRLGPLEVVSEAPHSALASRLDSCRVSGGRHYASLGDDRALAMQLLLPCWYWVALSHERPDGGGEALPCVQIFDRFGRALHRFYLRAPSRQVRALLECYRAAHTPGFTRCIEAANEPATPSPGKLITEWRRLRGDGDFSALLRRHRLRRIDACRAVAGHFSQPVAPGRFILAMAHRCSRQQPTAVSIVHGAGTHRHRQGFEHFNHGRCGRLTLESDQLRLSLAGDALTEAWLVTRRDEGGLSSRLEGFDSKGRLLVALAT
ncbi:ChuX/HutX family heme-like substrate-binding protein [Kushneria aurantia]|uniref:ChuX/HutX family heme-like substrate-binding protein n=1 Tax=Kushneria aurantia TaxID=504092 RepID=A0ABV6G728_9GAMM|nr:ChuX/HutX family heme-like substrate-binding protein [Kushneria aurantia]